MPEHPERTVEQKSGAKLILIDGLLVRGGVFALFMLVGVFLTERFFEGLGLVDYLTSGKTWVSFLFYFIFFGFFVGLDNWFSHKGSKSERYKIT